MKSRFNLLPPPPPLSKREWGRRICLVALYVVVLLLVLVRWGLMFVESRDLVQQESLWRQRYDLAVQQLERHNQKVALLKKYVDHWGWQEEPALISQVLNRCPQVQLHSLTVSLGKSQVVLRGSESQVRQFVALAQERGLRYHIEGSSQQTLWRLEGQPE